MIGVLLMMEITVTASKPLLKITCDKSIFFFGAQLYFNQRGFDWKATWKGTLREFSNNTQYLYLLENKTFGWGVKEMKCEEYTAERYKELFK